MQYLIASGLSFLLTVIFTPLLIHFLKKQQIGQTTREEGPAWHEVKAGTPTMGGLVFMTVIIVMSLIMSLINSYSIGYLISWLAAIILFGSIGFIDDFVSVFKKQNEGLTAKQKFIAQIISAGIVIILGHLMEVNWQLNIFGLTMSHPVLIILFSMFWLVGFSNAVNLTDGLDGLSSGVSIIAYGAYGIIAYTEEYYILAAFAFIVVGALLGFLIFNKKPAKIFMGDIGSLALGAGLAILSIMLSRPLSLLIIGGVFVIETASVILQVASFQLFGKRIFKMSPLHHHFELVGWSERRVVFTFWAAGLLCSIVYLIFFI